MRDIRCNLTSEEQKEAWSEFKQLRNKINNAKKNEEHKYKKNKISESLNNPAATWSTAKSFMNWKTSGTPHQLEVNNVLETKASGIARIMSDFFINKVRNLRDAMEPVPENLEECTNIMNAKDCSLRLQHTTIESVEKLLQCRST